MVQETTTYKEQSRVLLAQAFEELAKGDLAQASEKGWGCCCADAEGDCGRAGVGA